MMGKAINSLEIPVVKGMSGLLVMPEKESKRVAVYNCIRCAKCVSVCPMGLSPYLIAQTSEINKEEMAEIHGVMDCIECASCTHMCPAKIPLLDYCRLAKSEIRKMKNTKEQG